MALRINPFRMKKASRTFWVIALLLFITSLATCHFGVQHAINQIPPEIRARMSDTDWVGIEWIMRGTLLLAIAGVSAIIAIILRIMSWSERV